MTQTVSRSGHMAPVSARLEVQFATGIVKIWGESVDFPNIERALLFSIARNRHPSMREQLIDLVWGDAATEQTFNAFNVALHRLRRRLGGADAIAHSALGYALCDGAVVDLVKLETLARVARCATALGERELEMLGRAYEAWRHSADLIAGRYEWLEATNHRARELAAELGVAFGYHLLQRGNVAKALEVAHDLLDADGCDEAAAELVICALLKRGNRSAALRVYRRYCDELQRELGLRPSRRVETLFDRPAGRCRKTEETAAGSQM